MRAKIRLITQQNKWYCGPASVKMVLDSYGILKTQREIGKVLSATKEDGCDIPNNLGAFETFGVKAKYKKNSSLKIVGELIKKGIYPILYWNRKNSGGHYSVFTGIDEKRVYIADPGNTKRIISFTRERFLERWKDPENHKDKHEIIVITYP
ncbi:MAG: cysteine peptidase family C39 domain-containing protein [archaeon]